MKHILQSLKRLFVTSVTLAQYHATGDDGNLIFCGIVISSPLRRAGFAVVKPHLLLGIDEQQIALLQQHFYLRFKILPHVRMAIANRYYICITDKKPKKALHGKIDILTYDIKSAF